jgi:hypothetical protein
MRMQTSKHVRAIAFSFWIDTNNCALFDAQLDVESTARNGDVDTDGALTFSSASTHNDCLDRIDGADISWSQSPVGEIEYSQNVSEQTNFKI